MESLGKALLYNNNITSLTRFIKEDIVIPVTARLIGIEPLNLNMKTDLQRYIEQKICIQCVGVYF
jgi:hypothetical protein